MRESRGEVFTGELIEARFEPLQRLGDPFQAIGVISQMLITV
jgi:hypothetical protein